MPKETAVGSDEWPEGYFEIFAAQPEDPIERGPQGELEERLAFEDGEGREDDAASSSG